MIGRSIKRSRAALSRPAGGAKSLRQSITSSHSAHASIVALDRDGPTATEPSSLIGVAAVAAVASVVPLTVCRSPSIDPNATRSYVHTLSQTRRWRSNGHCANESQCNQCSRDQHGLSPFPVSFLFLCPQVKRREVCACSDGTSKETPARYASRRECRINQKDFAAMSGTERIVAPWGEQAQA
jgi:hypothetical protein